MHIFDSLLKIIAPHNCISCQKEGSIICDSCSYAELAPFVSCCYLCQKANDDHQVCRSCRRKTPVKRLFVATYLDKTSKKIIYKLKFDRAIEVAEQIAKVIDQTHPPISKNTVITYVPTSSSRIRSRGYDQSALIAKKLANKRRLQAKSLLMKTNQSRQVGASKKQRKTQADVSYSVKNTSLPKDVPILLVDDIVTTGATLEACTKLLKKAGFKEVNCLVFARKL